MYLNSHLDHLFVCGDVNAKLGTLVDYIEGIDNIPPRILIDNAHKNSHGDAFCNFLLE